MYNFTRDKIRKFTSIMAIVTILLISNYEISNANALDLSRFGIGNNSGQNAECVIVVI